MMRTESEIYIEYENWISKVADDELLQELKSMTEAEREDAFYRDLAFGTGGLRGTIGAGTNRMNKYVVAKASFGLAQYLLSSAVSTGKDEKPSVVIGYDSRIKSDEFAETAAGVFADQGFHVYLWPELTPVPTVSFAVRELRATIGVMITASHNPSKYNGYKVYGNDGCQITTKAAKEILSYINAVDIFEDPYPRSLDWAESNGFLSYISDDVMDKYLSAVKGQSTLFTDEVDRDLAIVYSPLNGTGLVPVTRVLKESGFTNITVVEEQRLPDGNFPTCPYPNPEIREAMELGLKYAADIGADLLLATDPDCDRCGIAVRTMSGDYTLLSGNETGLLLMNYICSQRVKHNAMPAHPVFIKTIVTMDLAERIAEHYGVSTINVLTGFKFIGEQIARLEDEHDYICGFEESYGYLTGSYVRDKDGVNAAFMICEMFAYYKTRGISLLEILEDIYNTYGYCLNTLHSYEFPGSSGMEKMSGIMSSLHAGLVTIAGMQVEKVEDYSKGLNGLPPSDVLKFLYRGVEAEGSVVIRPSGTEPKLKVYISVTSPDRTTTERIEQRIMSDLETRLFFQKHEPQEK